MDIFLSSYNTFKQSSLNTNYKKIAKDINYNDVNPTHLGQKK